MGGDDKIFWGKEPMEVLSRYRQQLCLNGLWEFMPATGPAGEAPCGEWGEIRVPGGWKNLIPWVPVPGIQRRGSGGPWETCDTELLEKGWYRRSIRIPEEWAGRTVVLTQRNDVAAAEVHIDGVWVGSFDDLTDSVDLTGAVVFGREALLTVKVQNGHGVLGDVFLQCRPEGAHIHDVFIRTSVRRQELALDVELAGLRCSGTVKWKAVVLDGKGAEVRGFSAETKVNSCVSQQVTMAWKWEDPDLWDVGRPNLYTLVLSAEGCGLEDEVAEVFGFREFWIEGRSFYLNGTEIRLRPVLAAHTANLELIEGALDGYARAGFNMAEMWPHKENDAGWALWYDCADRKGFPVSGPVGHLWDYLNDWDKPETRERYEKKVMAELRRVRNHPSILLWGTNGNVFGSGLGMDPRTLGVKKDHWYDSFYWRKRRAPAGEEGIGIIRKHDPTRPVFTHHGGGVGDVYTLNMYLNLTPLQEREEWLSHWVRHSDMPFMVVEFGTPLHVSFMRGRTDFPGAVVTEPLLTEYCAIYLGKEAYLLETEEYRRKIRHKFVEGQRYTSWHFRPYFDFAPQMQKVQALFSRNTWRSWRTMGITGGMLPWNDGHGWGRGPHSDERVSLGDFAPGRRGWYLPETNKGELFCMQPEGNQVYPAGQAIMGNNGPTLAWIAGPAGAFAAKDHNFRGGGTLGKQLVLLNDSRETQEYEGNWEGWADGILIGSGTISGELETGQTRFLPLELQLPQVVEDRILSGEIRLKANVGKDMHEDTLAFRVFPRNHRAAVNGEPENCHPPKETIHVWDPVGKTRGMLEWLGYRTQDWDGISAVDRVVVGRSVLSEGHSLPDGLEKYVREGGSVIVFNQAPEWMRKKLGFRVAHHISRRVFRVAADHPVVQGLEDSDLSDWIGESNLVEPYPEYGPENTRLAKWWFPYHGYHWGNRGGVCSAPVEKPHRSSWRPILECEFDLAYTPLMELDYGKGRVIWCTLDLEEHAGEEAAAERMASRILEYARMSPVAPKGNRTVLIGSREDHARLNGLGLIHEVEERIPSDASLVVLGSGLGVKELEALEKDLVSYIRSGGKALVLPRTGDMEFLGVRIRKAENFGGSTVVPPWEECRGISISDLRWRTGCDAWVVAEAPETGADGLLGRCCMGSGFLLFCQLDPEQLDADQKTYFRFTRWRQTRAVTQIFANLGAVFEMDHWIFHPQEEESLRLDGEWKSSLPVGREKGYEEGIVNLPALWERIPLEWEQIPDEVTFQKELEIPASWCGKDLLLSLGKIDNTEETYFNGSCISTLEPLPPAPHNYPRVYTVPGGLVKPGRNTVTVRIFDRSQRFDALGGGGVAGPAGEMFIKRKQMKGDPGFYHPDYRSDYVYGDDPYRYFNW